MSNITIFKEIGAVLLPDNEQWTNRFEIKSASSSRLYTIAQRKSDRSWGCSCPGWKSRRKCKHLTQLHYALVQIGGGR
jgi:hypothetical protein